MTPEQLKAIGIEPIWAETVIVRAPPQNNMCPLYTRSDLMKVCAAYEARVAELEQHLQCAGSSAWWAEEAARLLSQSSPLTALEEYRKKVLIEAAEFCDTQYERDLPHQKAGGQDNSDNYQTGYSEGSGDCGHGLRRMAEEAGK